MAAGSRASTHVCDDAEYRIMTSDRVIDFGDVLLDRTTAERIQQGIIMQYTYRGVPM
jgi:hypothetical protein